MTNTFLQKNLLRAYSVRRWVHGPSSSGVWEWALRQGAGTVTGSWNIDTLPKGRANCSAVDFWNLTVYTQWYSLYWLGLLLWSNIMTKTKLRKKGFIWLDIFNQSPLREAGARNQPGQNLEAGMDRLWRIPPYWPTPHGLCSRLLYSSQDH